MKAKPVVTQYPLRWHVLCLGSTIATFWNRGDAREFKKLIGGPDCCKVKYVKG